MHNCPSCKKPTSNLMVLDDGAIGNDVCDECTLIALVVAYPENGSLEESLLILAIDELIAGEAVTL